MDRLNDHLNDWNEEYLDFLDKARSKVPHGYDIVVDDKEQFRQQGESLIRHYDFIGVPYSPYFNKEGCWSFVKVARDVLTGVKLPGNQTVVADHESWGTW